ncbi:2-dehydropantoate 2-reductase [Caulobacter sp. Root487D2Y]|uniref:2-dehydropantoate 2-reductase n=1 Tax=Caulobacter sp. Root487D2Y TaxID=1736547 RepID=UPI0006FF92E9|nr:2-dehydropantoate 2-reductase [Caulobacter sp. Root487D2Y]KQY35552.1 2-dehydropantoate 2-reductase [Caulobacter sp. Root487D2Y]
MTRIAVIGPGAVGGVIAAWLAQNPELEVEVCVRTAFERLEVETPGGPLTARPLVLTAPDQASPVDWAIITTKTYDAAATGGWLARLVGPDTRVAVLQNGVEHVERFSAYVAAERITPAVVDIPAERGAPGRVRQRRDGSILVPEGAAGEAFVALFAHTPIAVSTTPDFKTAAWKKLALNCAGAVNALTLRPSGVARREPIAALMRALVGECVAVGRAEGADLPPDLPDAVVEGYRSGPADGVNSLHADRAAGRPMELDARNGVIVRLGARHGIATPVNAMVVALLEAAAEG